jgi:nucleoside-diphosphate-sugar epimerase
MLKNKNVLITGVTGFVGSNLLRFFLDQGSRVIIFTRATSQKWRISDTKKRVREFTVDLGNADQVKRAVTKIRPSFIIHTASYGGFFFQTDVRRILETNFSGTVNLLNACKKVGFDLFINTGSSSEYGMKLSPMKETDLPEPMTEYGVSKCSSTMYCQMLSQKEGLPIVTLRLFSPYGYYEDRTRLMAYVIYSCLKGLNLRLSSANSVRDYVFIEDVLTAYKLAMEKRNRIKGEVINIGSGRQHSVKEVVQEIIRQGGFSAKLLWNKRDNPRVEPEFWQADILKAKRLLDWGPRYDLRTGIGKYIAWFKNNAQLYK